MKRLILIFILFILTSCSSQPSEQAIQTAIAQTLAANPPTQAALTATPNAPMIFPPTWTPSPADTLFPTQTKLPDTPVPTIAPSQLVLLHHQRPNQSISGKIKLLM